MNAVLKKRLVGAGVLILFAAIVWPLLFDFESRNRDRLEQEWQQQSAEIDQQMAALKDETQRVKAELLDGEADDRPAKNKGESEQSPLDDTQQRAVSEVASEPVELEIPQQAADLVAATATSETTEPAGVTADSPLPASWIVQMATFTQWDNAEALLGTLLKDGEKAYLRPGRASSPPPYVVSVGPFFDKADAAKAGEALAAKYKTGSPIIRRFKSGQ